jgi:hypothetical protein
MSDKTNDLKFDEVWYAREVQTTDEADKLREAVWNALDAYADYLDRHGLIWDYKEVEKVTWDGERVDFLKADKLIMHIDFRGRTNDGHEPRRAEDGDCVRAYYWELVPHRPGDPPPEAA